MRMYAVSDAPRLDRLTQAGFRRHHERERRPPPSPTTGIMKYYAVPGLLILLSAVGFSTFAYVATTRPLSDLESVFLQVFSASTGLIGTFMIGRQSARNAASEVIKPHARSAFRRLMSQFQSLHRMASLIESSQSSKTPEQYKEVLARLNEIAITQISSADDALADWEDIVPEDVKELRQELSSGQSRKGRQ